MKNHERIFDIYSDIRKLKHEHKILADRRQEKFIGLVIPGHESISTQHLKRLVQIDRQIASLYSELRIFLTWTERLFRSHHSIYMEACEVYIKKIDTQIKETREHTKQIKQSKTPN